MFDYMGAFLFRSGFAHADNVITKRCSETITWLLLSRLQGNKPRSPEPSGTFPSGTRTRTRRNLLEPSSGTCSCDPHRRTPELIWAEDPISLRCWGKNKKYIIGVQKLFHIPSVSLKRKHFLPSPLARSSYSVYGSPLPRLPSLPPSRHDLRDCFRPLRSRQCLPCAS